MYDGKPRDGLNRKEKHEIEKFKRWERKNAREIEAQFQKFMHDWNNGNIEITIEFGGEIHTGEITKVEKPEKKPRSETLMQARDGYLAQMRSSYCLCRLCGQKITKAKHLTIDHKLAVVHGGEDVPENFQPAHKYCNTSRGSNFLEENAYHSVLDNTDVMELKFKDVHNAYHVISFTYYIDTGDMMVNSVVTDKYRRKTEIMTEYNKYGKVMKSMTVRARKDRYYNHNSLMYGRKKHQK